MDRSNRHNLEMPDAPCNEPCPEEGLCIDSPLARALLENAPEAIVVLDGRTGRFLFANENAARLFGRDREELLRVTPVEVSTAFQPNGRPSADFAREKVEEALAGGMPVFEWLHQHPSGRLFTSEVRLVRLPSEDRPLVRASIIDTTQRKRRERTQRAVYDISEAVHKEADLSSLYARIHTIVRGLMPAENFFIALYNPSNEIITFPYFVDELASGPPDPRPISTGLTGLVIRSGNAVLANRSFVERSHREHNQIVVEALGGMAYIESGRPAAVWLGVPLIIEGITIGVMAVQDYRDPEAYAEEQKQILTFVAEQTALAIHRKRAEESLRELVEKHRTLFAASSQGVMLHDEEKFIEVNPAAVRIMRRQDASEILGRHPRDFAPERQPNGELSDTFARRHISECLEKGSSQFEWLMLAGDGAHIPVEVLLSRVQWQGRYIIQAVLEDITERKRAESELLKALAREKELSELKTNFVSTVSHEFRTPLGIIMSSAQILSDYFDRLEPAERQEHLISIARNTKLMSSLMEEVLVLSRMDSGKLGFEAALIDVEKLARKLVEEVQSATNRQCPIELSLEGDLEAVCADERLLRHIFTNLLLNGIKYSPGRSPVEFHLSREENTLACVIRDHGIGIPDADREWIFQAFHRARNVGERPGTGLGLTIVKRCVELHGGEINLQSELGRGTTVTVRLPLTETPSTTAMATTR